MKRTIRAAVSLVLAAAILCGSGAVVFADQKSDTRMYLPDGSGATIQFADNKTSFFNFAGVVPGDTLTQTISVENRRGEAVGFYLQVTDPANSSLLNTVRMTITNTVSQQILYSGNMSGAPQSAYGGLDVPNGINLGSYGAKATMSLQVTLVVPPEVNNTMAGQISSVKWNLRAQLPDPVQIIPQPPYSPPILGGGGGGGSTYNPGQNVPIDTNPPILGGGSGVNGGSGDSYDPLTNINDGDIPMAGDLYSVPDGQVPLADLPKTGQG